MNPTNLWNRAIERSVFNRSVARSAPPRSCPVWRGEPPEHSAAALGVRGSRIRRPVRSLRRHARAVALAVLGLAAALFAVPEPAEAQTVTTFVSNTGQAGSDTSYYVRATSFTTGSGTYTLTSVGVSVITAIYGSQVVSNYSPLVQIFENDNNQPGTLLETLTNPASITNRAVNTFTAPAGITLSANTVYWLVTSNSAQPNGIGFQVGTISATTADSGAAARWSIGGALSKLHIITSSWESSRHRIRFQIRATAITDATLRALALSNAADDSAIALSPPFAAGTTSYTVAVLSGMAEITLAPTPTITGASIAYLDGSDTPIPDADTTKAGQQVSLAVDANTIKVQVTAEDTTTTLTYTVTVTRAATRSPDATLRALALSNVADDSAIALSPSFAAGTTSYTAAVLNEVEQITIAPTPTIAIASVAYLDGSDTAIPDADTTKAGQQVSLAVDANTITVQVTAEDTTTTLPYTVTVTRAATTTVTTFISNTGQAGSDTSYYVRATSFTTGSGTYTLTSVGVSVITAIYGSQVVSNYSPLVQIFENDNNQPGTLLETLTNPVSITNRAVNTFTAPAGITLSANTVYWLVTSNSAQPNGIGFQVGTISATTADSGAAARWSIGGALSKLHIITSSWESSRHRIRFQIRATAITDATLRALALSNVADDSAIALSPLFAAGTTSYTAAVSNEVEQITIAPTTTNNGASVEYLNGSDTEIPDADTTKNLQQVSLAVDANTIKVQVTAEDGATPKTYTVTVTRAATTSARVATRSPDATLRALALSNAADDSAIALSPPFAAGTTSYTVAVLSGMAEITLAPTPTIAGASVAYLDGSDTAIPDADTTKAGQQVSLAVGANTIKVQVTAEDTTTTLTYTVTSARVATRSPDATLRALALSNVADDSAIALSPLFAAGTTSYTAAVSNEVEQITIAPTTTNNGASVEYLNGSDTEIPDADTTKNLQQVSLAVDANTIKVQVTAEDGATPKTYTVTVTRAATTSARVATRSPDATLRALALSNAADDSAIALSPPFAAGTTSYTAAVSNEVEQITIAPTTTDNGASVEYLNSSDTEIPDADTTKAGQQVPLAVDATTITVQVTAEDGDTTLTYTVTVTRTPASAQARVTEAEVIEAEVTEAVVTEVRVTSTPQLTSDTYGTGETIEFTVTFSDAVKVEDAPAFRFSLGNAGQTQGVARVAAYDADRSTATKLVFTYEVQASDEDTDGIRVGDHTQTFPPDANDHITSNNAAAILTHAQLGLLTNHKVDGLGAPPPPPPAKTGTVTGRSGTTTGGGSGGGGGSPSQDDHGNTSAQATPVTLDPARTSSTTGQLNTAADVDYFSVDVPHAGAVVVETSGPTATMGTVWQAGAELATANSGGAGRNFRLGARVEAGPVVIALQGQGGATGAYTLQVTFVPGFLENPGANSFQSGIGLISGWTCDADEVEIVLNGEPQEAAYGTARLDTEAVCGDTDNGFGLLFNWNLLGDGEHEVVALVDGVELDRATVTVTVTTLGAEFLRDMTGTCTAADFPTMDETVTLAWQQTQQNFVIVDGMPPTGENRTGRAGVGYLENPGPNSFQSGIGVLSGWVCEGAEVIIELNGAPQPAAYGTERLDTLGACGDTANGFGLLFNWNLLGEGEHEVVAFVDGEELGRATVRVTTLGAEFVRDVEGECTVEDFPMLGETVTLEWQQNSQNFVITDVE